jgi:hypothetical protein
MKATRYYIATIAALALLLVLRCTKDEGRNPSLAYGDAALLDSCKQTYHSFYKNDPTLLSGAHGPHGTFKLRFNAVAVKALTDSCRLPETKLFPEGSLIIKDVYSGSDLSLYAFMYKRSGKWLWAEIEPSGSVHHGVNGKESVCTGCHSQNCNRDLVLSFCFY